MNRVGGGGNRLGHTLGETTVELCAKEGSVAEDETAYESEDEEEGSYPEEEEEDEYAECIDEDAEEPEAAEAPEDEGEDRDEDRDGYKCADGGSRR